MSAAPIIVVTGTGTEIGKTHFSTALLYAWAEALAERGLLTPKVLGIKPVESGVVDLAASDVRSLERASTFHVKHSPPYMLSRPVSPHLAARDAGTEIKAGAILSYLTAVRAEVDALLVELPGGLFSPLSPRLANFDVAAAIGANLILLCAPDRLGVLHDVGAATRAATAANLRIDGIVLLAPATPDASTGTNADELHHVTTVPVVANVPRGEPRELAKQTELRRVVRSPALSR